MAEAAGGQLGKEAAAGEEPGAVERAETTGAVTGARGILRGVTNRIIIRPIVVLPG